MLHRICAILPGILLLLLLTACAEQTQPSLNTEQTSASSQAETSSKAAASTSVSTTQPVTSDPAQPTQEDPIPDGYVVAETVEPIGSPFVRCAGHCPRRRISVMRWLADRRIRAVCRIEGGFQTWHIGEDGSTVTLLCQDSTWAPTTFPELLRLRFDEAGVSCQKPFIMLRLRRIPGLFTAINRMRSDRIGRKIMRPSS